MTARSRKISRFLDRIQCGLTLSWILVLVVLALNGEDTQPQAGAFALGFFFATAVRSRMELK